MDALDNTWLVPILLAAVACNAHPQSNAASELSASPETHLEATVAKGAAPAELVAGMAKRYAQALVVDGPLLQGELRQGAHRDFLLVLRGGSCYRVLGAAGEGVEDLDLLLYDPNGVEVQQDPQQDRFPVLGLQSELCPPVSGAYRLQTLMYRGAGPYALRVYRTP